MKDVSPSIVGDLRHLISGEVLFDDITRSLFSTAACIYRVEPMGVVLPKNTDDVVRVVRYCAERGISITGRGAGTSLAGQPLNSGIIVVFNKYFKSILSVDRESRTARVEPGVVLADLNKAAGSHRLMFGPDPSSGKQCVVGGMVGTNAAGAHTVKYGSTKDSLIGVKFVTSDGEVLDTSDGSTDELSRKVANVLKPHREQIIRSSPKVPKNSSGYNLPETIAGEGVNLTKLLCGSEGTLGLTLEATLKLVPAPAERRSLIAYFPSYEASALASNESLRFEPAAVELLDKSFAAAAIGLDPQIDSLLREDFVAILIFEFEEGEPGLADAKIKQLSERLKRLGLTNKQVLPRDAKEAARLWRVRKEASSIFYRIEEPGRKTSFVEDVAVPVDRLPDYFTGAQSIFRRNGLKYALYGHAASGNVHAIVLLDLKNRNHLAKIDPVAGEIYNLAISLGGTLSGEHGDGFLRTPFLSKLYGNEIYSLFGRVKEMFDPHGILNPGKIVGQQDCSIVHDLRYGGTYGRVATETPLDLEKIAHEIEKCHGCGTCLSYCPTALVTRDERATPRAKGNLLRSIISGDLGDGYLGRREFKEVLDYCFNCKLCLTECPTQIDIPGMVIEAKTIYLNRTGKTSQDKFINRLPILSSLGSITPTMANMASSLGFVRNLLERLFGIDRRRELPRFHKPLFKRIRINRETPDPQKKVIYFSGCFANFNDPTGEGLSTIEILRRNKVDVRVLDTLRCCGIARITTGDRDAVSEDARWNVAELAKYVRTGFDIVASAPSCGLALKRDYPDILDTDESRIVSDHVFDLTDYLSRLFDDGVLNTNFGELKKRVTYHNPCHSVPMNVTTQPIKLMRMVPGLDVAELAEDKCCGMAGTFGLKKQFYDLSIKAGDDLFRQIGESNVDVVVTTCGTCNIQIAQGTGKEVEHLATVLNDSYRAYDKLGAPKVARLTGKDQENFVTNETGIIE